MSKHTPHMDSIMKRIFTTFAIIAALIGLTATSMAQLGDGSVAEKVTLQTGDFEKARYNIRGGWKISTVKGITTITFDDSFKTRSGPDLKLFLSPKPVSAVNGKTAQKDAVKIGILKSNKGTQSYTVPSDVNLSDYKSVLIQCEAFSVLWGGFDIPE